MFDHLLFFEKKKQQHMTDFSEDLSALRDDLRLQAPENSSPTSSVDIFIRIVLALVVTTFFVMVFVIVPRAGFALNTGYLPPGANCTTWCCTRC